MTLPTLTRAQRLRNPLIAAAFDCLREPKPGEDVIEMSPKARGAGLGGASVEMSGGGDNRGVGAAVCSGSTASISAKNKKAPQDRESREAKTTTTRRKVGDMQKIVNEVTP